MRSLSRGRATTESVLATIKKCFLKGWRKTFFQNSCPAKSSTLFFSSRVDARLMPGYSVFWVLRCRCRACSPLRMAADAACSLASPKRRFTLREKRPLPRHLRIGLMADCCPKHLDDRGLLTLIRFVSLVYGSGFIRLPSGNVDSGVHEGAEAERRSPFSLSNKKKGN